MNNTRLENLLKGLKDSMDTPSVSPFKALSKEAQSQLAEVFSYEPISLKAIRKAEATARPLSMPSIAAQQNGVPLHEVVEAVQEILENEAPSVRKRAKEYIFKNTRAYVISIEGLTGDFMFLVLPETDPYKDTVGKKAVEVPATERLDLLASYRFKDIPVIDEELQNISVEPDDAPIEYLYLIDDFLPWYKHATTIGESYPFQVVSVGLYPSNVLPLEGLSADEVDQYVHTSYIHSVDDYDEYTLKGIRSILELPEDEEFLISRRPSGNNLLVLTGNIRKYIKDYKEEKLVQEALNEGKTVSTILQTTDISAGRLYSLLDHLGIPRKSTKVDNRVQHIKDNPKVKEQLFADYLAGASTELLYKKYDLYKNGLYYLLDINGIPRRR